MRARHLVSVVPMLVLWAGCSSSPPSVGQEGIFVPNDEESIRLAEEISLSHVESIPELATPVGEIRARRTVVDVIGEAHTRLRQSVDGIPVFGAEAIIHLNADGSYQGITDKFLRDVEVDTTPAYAEREAVDIAVESVGGYGQLTGHPAADLQILRHEGVDHLTFRVQLETVDEELEPAMPVVFVDAHSGDVVWSYNNLKHAKNRATYDARNRTSLPGTLRRSEGQGPHSDPIVNMAHDNAGLTYDYYWNNHGRDSYNGAGAQIRSTVHYSKNYVNAFWNGTQMVYGDGNGSDSSALTVLDVVGHELTHAVTDTESDLIYSNESGALNEAMSDIFGASIEAYRDGAVSGNTWKIGEECWTPGIAGDALRYMNDPSIAGDYDYWPTRYTGSSDNGGVHWNSGIANLAFYLMVSGGTHPQGKTSNVVPALNANPLTSLNMGAAIFYQANTACLTPSSNFSDARGCTVAAANALYGAAAATSVDQAWIAVGVPGAMTWTTISSQGNLSGGTGSTASYQFNTPAGAAAMQFSISGGSGDADMYVKFGSAPTTSSYDCRPYLNGNNETCTFNPSQNGTYYVMIRAYSAYSGVTLTAKSAQ